MPSPTEFLAPTTDETDDRVKLGSCSACGALVATSDPAAVAQHKHWHDIHPGPPPIASSPGLPPTA